MLPSEILKKIRRIEIHTSRLVNDVLAGEYHSVFKGRGMTFAEVREYVYGDDVRTIDWNVTARTGQPHVKVFDEERELTVMLLVDASASGNFGSSGSLKRELATEISALLAFSAIKNNDRVGLVMFTDRVELVVPPKKGRKHVLRLVRDVLSFEPAGRGTDLAAALDYLSRLLSRRAVVFLVSDFLAGGYRSSLTVTARKHDLVAVRVSDARESSLPAVGLLPLEDPETGERLLVDASDPLLREIYEKSAEKRETALRDLFKSTSVDLVEARCGEPYEENLVRFFKKRARRAVGRI